MEIRVLRYFLKVAREENITRAAALLHISQPTLSRQIKDLEEELGKKLFVRGNYSIKLTDEGMLLRKRAEDILDMVDKTAAEFRALDEIVGGDIHIGCAEADGIKHFARCAKTLTDSYPNVRFHLHSGNQEDVSDRLDKGLLDFAIVVGDVDLTKYNHIPLPGADTWGIVMPEDSPLAKKSRIEKADLLGLPLILSRQALVEEYPLWFGEEFDDLNIAATFNLAYNAGILAREGLGYAVVFDKLINTAPGSGLCFRPLYPGLTSEMNLVWKKYQMFSPAAQLLLGEMRREFTPEDVDEADPLPYRV